MIDIQEHCTALMRIQNDLMLTQKELAMEIGVSYATLYRLIYKSEYSFSMATLRKVKKFVDKYSKDL